VGKVGFGSALIVVGASILLAGCGGGGTAGSSSPSASASPSASVSSSPALSCELPVASIGYNNGPSGFISFPSGTFQADTNSKITYEAATARYRTTQSPVLFGDSSVPTYDAARQRWLPVRQAAVLPDGSAYVYTREASPTQFRNEIHLVNVATGEDRMIYNQGAYDTLAYNNDGVYLQHHLNGADAANGLWVLNPTTGSIKAFPTGEHATWAAIAWGAAWSYSVDGNRFGSSKFARMDLSTGAITTWFDAGGTVQPPENGSKSVRIFGFDGSQPLVEVWTMGGTPEAWLLKAPGQSSRLPDVPLGQASPPQATSDSHGTWLIGSDGVYLYNNSRFTRLAAAPPGPSGSYGVAGPCS
jgi:hypothetical protein